MSYHQFRPDDGDEEAFGSFEVFYVDARGYCNGVPFVLPHEPGEQAMGLAVEGWYWWPCFPGCMPDSVEPIGPFPTEQAAINNAHLQ